MDVFSPLAGGQMSTYFYPSESPIDFDAGLDFTRPRKAVGMMPTPPMIGYIDGLLPLLDAVVYASMTGKTDFGPFYGVAPNLAAIFPNITGSMHKVTG